MRRVRVAQRDSVVAILVADRYDVFTLRGINTYWDDGYPVNGGDYSLNQVENCLIVLSDGHTICCAEDDLSDVLREMS